MALWAVIIFTATILLVALFVFLTGWMKEPQKTESFRRLSVVWIRTFYFLTGCRFKVKGTSNFEKGKLYVVTANHNSFLDVTSLTPFIPGPNKTIAKIEMSRIPIFGLVYKRGSILVDRKDKDSRKHSFMQMIQVLQNGMHVCIYPEGTRNKTNLPLKEFHDGAFRLAMDTGKDVLPAILLNTKKAVPPGKGFYFKPMKMELHFLAPISVKNFESYDALKTEVKKQMWDYIATHQK